MYKSNVLILSYVTVRRCFQLKRESSRMPFGPRNRLEENVTSGCRIERSSSFWASLVSFVEQREPVFGLWLELPGTLSPQRITANLLRPLLSLSLFLFLSLSFSFLLLPFSPRFFRRYISHSIFSHGSSSSSYTCLDILPLSCSLLDVVQVVSKRTTGSSRRGSFLSLRLFAHLFLSALSALPLYRSLSLLSRSLLRSSLLVQRRTWRLASSIRHFKIPPNLSNRRRVPRKPSLYLWHSRSSWVLLFVSEHRALSPAVYYPRWALMTTIKRLTGIARSGFEPMGAYGGIPTRRELGGWKRMAPCWKSARRHCRGEIHTRRGACVPRLASRNAGWRNAVRIFESAYMLSAWVQRGIISRQWN